MKQKKLTDEAVVKRCVELGVEGGWEKDYEWLQNFFLRSGDISCQIEDGDYLLVFFNHSWAKAVFGEKVMCPACGAVLPKEYKANKKYDASVDTDWRFHLQQLALAPNRIQYMREWLVENKKIKISKDI